MPIIWDFNNRILESQKEIDKLYTPFVQRVHDILDWWFTQMESGAGCASPDPRYPKTWTDEQLDALVQEIDGYTEKQRTWANAPYNHTTRDMAGKGLYETGPGFERLSPAERLALAQDLHRATMEFGLSTGPKAGAETPSWMMGEVEDSEPYD